MGTRGAIRAKGAPSAFGNLHSTYGPLLASNSPPLAYVKRTSASYPDCAQPQNSVCGMDRLRLADTAGPVIVWGVEADLNLLAGQQ